MTIPLPDLRRERRLWRAGLKRVAGVDEAGRGALAGPVCAAAVVLPDDPRVGRALRGVRDSKQMTARQREERAAAIKEVAIFWGVGFASAREIDALGILPATRLAVLRALTSDPRQAVTEHADLPCDFLLTDCLLLPEIEVPQLALLHGDQLSLSVAAASVLAKTARDSLLCDLDRRYPGYGFAIHKGYGTAMHRAAIRQMGPCPEHRRSFTLTG